MGDSRLASLAKVRRWVYEVERVAHRASDLVPLVLSSCAEGRSAQALERLDGVRLELEVSLIYVRAIDRALREAQ